MNQTHPHIDGYVHISTSIDKTQRRMDAIREGKVKPLFTASKKERDKIGGYYPSDQVVIAARTGTGKSSKILQDLLDFSDINLNPFYKDNLIFLYDSWEMSD